MGIKLNIGCGTDIKPKSDGWINIDYKSGTGVDLVIDFNSDRLINHFKEDSVDYIYCNHFLEHVINPVDLVFDCLNIIKTSGEIVFRLPNTGIDQLYHFRDYHGKSYMNCITHFDKSLQSKYGCSVKSSYSKRNKGFRRFFRNNTHRFRDWFMRCFYDETTHIIKKNK